MHSCLYHGSVRHRRLEPAGHAFRYRLALLYLDLAETANVFRGRWFWSAGEHWGLAHWHRSDHYGDPARDLGECMRELVRDRAGIEADGPVRLLTHPRHFGYGFNPVSFYYCFDAADRHLVAIVAEINNTPWGERHCYVLPQSANHGTPDRLQFKFDKDFHVSPFMPMDLEYDWRFTRPGEVLAVHMENRRDGRRLFDVTLTLRRQPITGTALAASLARHPLVTFKVTAAIYWQALRLWLKRMPLFTHPDKTGAGHRQRAGRIDPIETTS